VSSVPIALQEILLATDFREPARRALAFAKQIAHRRAVLLRAVHVLDLTVPGEGGQRSFAAAHDSAQLALRDIRRELRLAGIEHAATLISAGKPSSALRELVQQHQPSLLILGLNGTPSQNPAALGATARALLAAPPCSILTVNEHCPELPAADALERVVIVIDAVSESLRAALAAWPLAPHQPAPLILVVQPRRARAASKLPDLPRHFRAVVVVDPTEAADAVLRHAAKARAGLIVTAFAGKSPLRSLARGTLACAMLTQAPCPVLTVRA
jgi:nucleotide-binding universal stress UspA family protein